MLRRHRTPLVVAVASLVLGAMAAAGSGDAVGSVGSVGAPAAPAAVTAAAVPAGFVDAAVVNVPQALAVAALPDGRVLVSTQGGQVRVVDDRALLPTPALDLGDKICANSERGLLGLAVDPDFAENRFVFALYTWDRGGACVTGTTAGPVNRVSRFVMNGNTIDPASEKVLIDGVYSFAGNHNGGDIHFGADGYLYASFGDGGCDYRGDSGCQDANNATRDRNVLLGKIARITRFGAIPPGNPFTGEGTARCNAGPAPVGQVCRETFAGGLRNPFRFATAANGRIHVNDVGGGQWEEVDLLAAGADYGWNVREGGCALGSATNCGPPPAGMTNPIHAYNHSIGCSSITAGAFVPGGAWGSSYRGGYLFGDYTCGRIWMLRDGRVTTFASGLAGISPISMAFVAEGGTQSLYYTDLDGVLRRITPPSSGNRAPTARVRANPTSGYLPLSVSFNASGSSDPDGDDLSYRWTWGDGTRPITTDGPRATHVYAQRGTYTATVTVNDGRGGVSPPATIEITAGNTAPGAFITAPTADTRFRVGQTITLSAFAADREDGVLGPSALSWRVIRRHADHTHPFLPPTVGNDVTFTAPSPEDLRAASNSFLEVILTVTDSRGASRTYRQDLLPRTVLMRFRTDPGGLRVTINGVRRQMPFDAISWTGFPVRVDIADQDDAEGNPWVFDRWSDGGARRHIITSPRFAKTYVAYMRRG